jgi:hypothetical protein
VNTRFSMALVNIPTWLKCHNKGFFQLSFNKLVLYIYIICLYIGSCGLFLRCWTSHFTRPHFREYNPTRLCNPFARWCVILVGAVHVYLYV